MAEEADKDKLKFAQQLYAAMAKQLKAMESTTKEMNSQFEIMTKMREATKDAADGVSDPLDQAKETKEVLKEVLDITDKNKDSAKQHGDALADALKKSEAGSDGLLKSLTRVGKQFPVMKTAALAASHGILEGFRGAMAISSSLLKVTMSLVAGLGRVGVAILAIPFKIFQGLIDKAESGGGGNELAAAYEAVRKQFGDFRQDASHNVIATARSIDAEFKQTGLSTWRVFGTLAQRLELVNKVATAMGATFDVLGSQFATDAGHILAYQKALGISEEGMKEFGQAAIRMGKPLQEVFRETASLSLSMQKQFGGSAKLYSRDMGKMINDVKHFGGVSQKVMVETAVYTRKLGIETDKLLGMLDKFDTFDDAAQSAAKLAQTYGANVDAFKLMTAESPVEQLDMIRKAMFEAGKSAETMDRKDFKYIASITGMDEATVAASLSIKNQGVSLDKLREGSAKAEKQQLSQVDAMKQLAGAIERLTQGGSQQFGGFIKALIKGFNDGIEWTAEFRRTMISIRQDLRIMYFTGREIGKAFVDAFPGVKQMMTGLMELFDPKKFQVFASGLSAVFKKFFSDLTTNPKMAFSELMKGLKEKFFDFFNAETRSGNKILSGLKSFMSAMSHILAGALKFIMESLTEGFKMIGGLMNGKGLGEMAAGAKGIKKAVLDFLAPIWESFKEAWPALKNAFVEMVTMAWEKIKSSGVITKALEFLKTYILGVAGVSLGAGLAKGLGAILVGSIAKGLAAGIGGAATNGIASKLKGAATGGSLSEKGVGELKTVIGEKGLNAGDAKNMTSAVSQLDKGAKSNFNIPNILRFLVLLAGVLLVLGGAVYLSIIVFRQYSYADIIKGLFVIGGMAAAMLPIAASLGLLSYVKIDPASAALGIGAITLALLAMTAAVALIYGAFSIIKPNAGEMDEIVKVIFGMSKIFLVTGVVLLAATGIGLIVASGFGGAAMLAGFAAMAIGVGSMTLTVIEIMKSLAKIDFANGLPEKVDMFVKILTAVTAFAHVFAKILDSLSPSIASLLSRDKTTLPEKINAVNSFINAMIGPPGGIIGLVNKLLDAITQLKDGGPAMTESAALFASLLGAVASLATAMTPPDELFKATGGLFKSSDATGDAISELANYNVRLTSSLESFMASIAKITKEFLTGNYTAEQIQKLSGLATIFSAVGTFSSAIKVSPDLLKNMMNADGEISLKALSNVGDLMGKYANSIRKVIGTVGVVIVGLAKNMSAVSSSQIDTMKALAPILESVFSLVRTLFLVFNQAVGNNTAIPNMDAKRKIMDEFMINAGTMITSVGASLPNLINKLKSGVDAISGDEKTIKTYETKFKIVKTVFEVVKTIMGLIGSVKVDDFGGNSTQNLIQTMEAMKDKVDFIGIGVGEMFASPDGPLFKFIKVMNDEVALLPEVSTKALGKIDSMTKVLSASTNITKSISGVNDAVKVNLAVVSDMVKSVNALSEMLASDSLMKIDIAPKLETLAKTVGMGGKGTYSIQHKPITITVNMHIAMDAKTIEHQLVDRSTTSINFDKNNRWTIDQ